jgi:hypothetical protein
MRPADTLAHANFASTIIQCQKDPISIVVPRLVIFFRDDLRSNQTLRNTTSKLPRDGQQGQHRLGLVACLQ